MKKFLPLLLIALLVTCLTSCFSVKLPVKDIPVVASEVTSPSPAPSSEPAPIPTPEPTPSPEPSPAPHTMIIGNIGLTITYPDDWTVLRDDEIDTLYSRMIDLIKGQFKDPGSADKAIKESIPISMAMKYPVDYKAGFNPNINIIVKPLPGFLAKDMVGFVQEAIKQAKKQTSADITFGKPVSAKIGNAKGVVYNAQYKILGFTISEQQYYLSHDGYVAIITCASIDKTDKKALQDMIKSIVLD